MKDIPLYHLFTNVGEHDFFLVYRGVFSDNLTDKILQLNEKNVESSDILSSSRKKISFLLVESFQNILRYGGVLNQDLTSNTGMFILKLIDHNFYITSVNLIDTEQVEGLKCNIDDINSANREDLKKNYIQRLGDMASYTEKGTGLGFMEMVRKSQNPLRYTFQDHDAKQSVFYLTICFGDHARVDKSDSLINDQIYHYFVKNDILLTFKSEFKQDKIQPIWKIINDNLSVLSANNSANKKRFLALVALSQNITHHAVEQKRGILQVIKRGERLLFEAGNYISEANRTRLDQHFKLLKTMNFEQLHQYYLKQLSSTVEADFSGLALIEVFKYATQVDYEFMYDGDKIFYRISVEI